MEAISRTHYSFSCSGQLYNINEISMVISNAYHFGNHSCTCTHFENLETGHLDYYLEFHTNFLLQRCMFPVHTAEPIMSPYILILPASTDIVLINTPIFHIN